MLSGQSSIQLNIILGSLSQIVSSSIDVYEEQVATILSEIERESSEAAVRLVLDGLLNRIIEEKPTSVYPLYATISKSLIDLNFNVALLITSLTAAKSVIREVVFAATNRNNTEAERFISNYIDILLKSLDNLSLYTRGLTSDQLIQLISPYAPSEALREVKLLFEDRGFFDGKSYSLFSKDIYWEEQVKQLKETKQTIVFPYTIYNNKLYNLNSGVSVIDVNFSELNWSEYSPRFLNKSQTFNKKLADNVRRYITKTLEFSEEINESISDSYVERIDSNLLYTERDLENSFAGKGKDILSNLLTLKSTCYYFGNNEASPVGNVDYISSFCEYLYAFCYGRTLEDGFCNVEGVNIFGKFNDIFFYGTRENKMAGLSFLDSFSSLKSFNQGLTIYDIRKDVLDDPSVDKELIEKGTDNYMVNIKYNPIYSKYREGLEDRFEFNIKNPYVDNYEFNVDVILFGIESIYSISNNLGGLVSAVSSTLDSSGRLPGYEGLGPISVQIEELSKIFISPRELEYMAQSKKILPGMNGLCRYLLDSYKKLISVVPDVPFTGNALRKLSTWGRKIQYAIENMYSEVNAIGYAAGTFIPNISFKSHPIDQSKVINQLRSLNFQESEINLFLSCETFEELLLKFSPITDSKDQISFFKGYELAQLVYEFGGESAIDSYISYLYSNNENDLTSLLEITLKNQSKASVYNSERFGKLVGLMVNLTHAINPDQLEIFKKYLEGNRLTFFESISFLLNNDGINILLSEEEISLLKPVAESLIYGKSPFGLDSYSIDYQTAYKEAPVSLKQWTDILDENIGNASTNLIKNLYDKSEGLTAKELMMILNPESFHNELGQILNGYEGGKLTKFISYAYLSGILYKVGTYNNSYQIPNFFVSGAGNIKLEMLVGTIEALITSLEITLTNFVNNIEDELSQGEEKLYDFNNIKNSYNKSIFEISSLIKNLVPVEGDITNLRLPEVDPFSLLIGPPGIGNSPLPKNITRVGSISPEQANQLSSEIVTNFSFTAPIDSSNPTESDVLGKFIKYIDKNKEILGTPINKSYVEKTSDLLTADIEPNKSDREEFNRSIKTIDLSSFGINPFIKNIEDQIINNLVVSDLLQPFSAIGYCKKFGGQNCEELYKDMENPCGEINNRAIYPENDNSDLSTIKGGSIPIDRASGRSSGNNFLGAFIPNNSNNKPIWFDLLPGGDSLQIGTGGEPIIGKIYDNPIVFKESDFSDTDSSSSSGSVSSVGIVEPSLVDKNLSSGLAALYYDSSTGLIEAIKANYEKDEPFKCSLLEDTYAYLACMNLLKCKKFQISNNVPYLRFCPKTLAGGLNK